MLTLYRKEIIGIITIILGIVSYILYIKDMLRGTTRPHIFSRIIRGLGAWIVFAGQRSDGAGAGAWSNFMTGFICVAIAVYAHFHHGSKYITTSDKVFFIAALLALALYMVTDTRLWSIILINIADIFSVLPTIRKSRDHPYTETISLYALSSIKFLLMLLATDNYSFITISNTILWVVINAAIVIFLYVRRRQFIMRNT